MLEIRLFGAFELTYGGKPIDLPSRAAQSLFAYLVMNRSTPHRREKLAGMFWPDSPEERARASLRHELWRIRKVLTAGGAADVLLADDITVAFAPAAAYALDVACFEQAADDVSVDQLKDSLSAYRGELLPGFYEDWVVAEREHLQRLFEKRVERLLELLEAEKCWLEMVEWAERWLALNSAAEPAYRALMVAYAGMDDRTKLLAAHERCVRALQEVGLEPSEEVRALLETQRAPSNLPAPLGTLIGREAELAEVSDLVNTHRLVTLTGAGGVGKTRLVIEVARSLMDRFPDGVCYLELAPVQEPGVVAERLRNLLRLRGRPGEEQPAIELLCTHFRLRHALLVIDNCEHLIEACAQLVNSLLTACPGLHVLCTSREALRVAGEVAYRVPSLGLPSSEDLHDLAAVVHIASIRLFFERARARARGFAATAENVRRVAEICMRLDGIPLAIELAAARIGTLPLETITDHLNDRFGLLSGGLRTNVPRHQTLRAMIDWSHDLLSEPERVLLRRLSVFAGGWTLDAADKVAGEGVLRENDVLGLLPELVEKSLVVLDASSGRYGMLETIREYALERLKAASEEERLRDRHLDYFIGVTEAMYASLPRSEAGSVALAPDQGNLLAAVRWCESAEGGVQKGLQLIGALWLVFSLLGQATLGYQLLRHLLELPGAADRTPARGLALVALAEAGTFMGHENEAWSAAQEAVSIGREIGDRRMEARALRCSGSAAGMLGKREQAIACFEASMSISQELGLVRLLATTQGEMAEMLRGEGEPAKATVWYRQAVATVRSIPAYHDLPYCLANLSASEILTGELASARQHVSELLDLMEELPYGIMAADAGLMACSGYLAAVGDPWHAACLLGAAEKLWEVNMPLDRADQLFAEYIRETACEVLGAAAWQTAHAEGRRLSAKEAVALAREWLVGNK